MDEHFLYRNIKSKQDIFREILLLKRALKPYIPLLGDHNPLENNTDIYKTMITPNLDTKSKIYYTSLVDQKREKPTSQNKIMKTLKQNSIDFKCVYLNKIKNLKDLKLSEFNYKVLNNILPCNKNLKLWGKQPNDKCDICDYVHDIYHLLFECEFNKVIWAITSSVLGCNLTITEIIIGCQGKLENFIISLICYNIYKFWLICKNEERNRTWKDIRVFLWRNCISPMKYTN